MTAPRRKLPEPTIALSEAQVREALEEGRQMRRELEERVRRMHQPKSKTNKVRRVVSSSPLKVLNYSEFSIYGEELTPSTEKGWVIEVVLFVGYGDVVEVCTRILQNFSIEPAVFKTKKEAERNLKKLLNNTAERIIGYSIKRITLVKKK